MPRTSPLFRVFFACAVMAIPLSCNLFHPNRIAPGPFFVVEKELVGSFEGRRLIFNAFDSLVATANARRQCSADFEQEVVHCSETVVYLTGQTDAASEGLDFSIHYSYETDAAVQLEYRQAGVEPNRLRVFRGGESRGAAIQVYGDSVIPRSSVRSTMDMTLIRQPDSAQDAGLAQQYYERRQYSYLGLPIGYELTFWQRPASIAEQPPAGSPQVRSPHGEGPQVGSPHH